MKKLYNMNEFPREFVDDPDFVTGLKTMYLGHAAGSEHLYVNIDLVKPGAKSVKYHSHSHQEEFFLILEGTGILRWNNEEITVNTGDFIAKPAGKGLAHQFINNSTEILKILDCGLKVQEDVAIYPDEDVEFHRHSKQVFQQGKLITDWSSDPNQ